MTGTAYLHIDRGRGASADLTLVKLRAAVLASDALSSAKDKEGGGKQIGEAAAGPTVEVAPFQKVRERVCSGAFSPLERSSCCCGNQSFVSV